MPAPPTNIFSWSTEQMETEAGAMKTGLATQAGERKRRKVD